MFIANEKKSKFIKHAIFQSLSL